MTRVLVRLAVLLGLLVAGSGALLASAGDAAQRLVGDYWHAEYLFGHQAGYLHIVVERTTYQGSPAYRWSEKHEIRTKLGDSHAESMLDDLCYLDDSFAPKFESVHWKASRSDTGGQKRLDRSAFATYSGDSVEVSRDMDGKTERRRLNKLPLDLIRTNWRMECGIAQLREGTSVESASLDLFDMQVDRETYAVAVEEDYRIGSTTRHSFSLSKTGGSDGARAHYIVLDNGIEADRTSPDIGRRSVLKTREEVLAGYAAQGADLSDAGKIKSDVAVSEDGRITQLTVRLKDIYVKPEETVSDARQSVTAVDERTLEYRLSAVPFDPANSLSLGEAGAKNASYLKRSQGVESDSQQVRDLARQIVGTETNAYKAALKLSEWVFTNVDADAAGGIHTSALEVLTTKTGVCRQNALLYTALARAAGIPTKLASGFIYSDGAFCGHAWAESFVGAWVPIDSTKADPLADGTYLKLRESAGAEVFDLPKTALGAHAQILAYEMRAGRAWRRSPEGSQWGWCPRGMRAIECKGGGYVCLDERQAATDETLNAACEKAIPWTPSPRAR